ncbi:aromatic acid exporter family protein [Domibacillus sp. DTU_2020_1001157_1_SI_ALB_TIR_016]|uniref:FUSC family protein n=1 Tax=Domibacillus sp. DTU_2020_1001157_1_SI_ALB_TIR_016 TaxID=3077789 RepID=UPI0028E7152E|nr:aromatic acid exporter family protein [Domibacillus sp. DTU_2020_1001157_1_SI_ALB_TIR_016]WNS79503.1 aromatic acid exporter family protein [Domibacillus sp. DTU_2020_1001157_1_SI_ALB_TIR_016]
MTLGPRVFKTGIAVTLSLYICYFLNLEPAVFAAVAALFTIQPSIYRSWRQLLDQVMTNTMGAAISLFSIYFIGDNPIIIGVLMMLVISLSLKMKMESTIPLTLVTVLAIMSTPDNENIDFILNRFLIILVGIGSALVVNLLIIPPNYKKNYLEKTRTVFQNMSLLLRTAVSNELTETSFQEQSKKLQDDIRKLEDLFKMFDEERTKLSKLKPVDVREIVLFKQMLKTLQQGEEILENIEEHYFQTGANEAEDYLFDTQIEQLIKYHEYLFLKYEGKIKQQENHHELKEIKESAAFFERALDIYKQNKDQKFRLLIIASSIVEYSFHLQRMDQLIDQYYKVRKV